MSAYSQKRISPSGASVSPESGKQKAAIDNVAAKGVPFYTPEQDPPAGTAVKPRDGFSLPKLFSPLKSVALCYRIASGSVRCPGSMMIEATAVQANGRITPEDSGIWLHAHMETMRKHVDFSHRQNALIGIQIAHAGRKVSTVAPWLSSGATAEPEAHGWPDDVVGPSSEPFSDKYPMPRSMSLQEIDQLKKDFVAAAIRVVDIGFDVIELHFAHGYLVSSFLSPAVNKRSGQYGGSFENRTRLATELVRETPPPTCSRTKRRLAQMLAQEGVDVIDVSSGGNHPAQKVQGGPGYQAKFAKAIKQAVGDKMLVSTVGSIKSGTQAQEIIAEGQEVDLVAAGRMFQKNPGLVWAWANDLGFNIQVAHQIGWGFGGRAAKKQEHVKLSIP
ncbi:NADPH dehydrogenase afvA [Fusarium oxysporum f. sp. rapae]|uniref:NADPH dehydrogenase afvA n=1 Tax=Fusarium oxysporum f. sp. rapae TaxID=485398 RepID=A0A8J5P2B2_FUSOX|nr:NADPH dehydrogenase afvA [Fusarium oxysporum f. sp. rapae]